MFLLLAVENEGLPANQGEETFMLQFPRGFPWAASQYFMCVFEPGSQYAVEASFELTL